jgi:hypothetical protein
VRTHRRTAAFTLPDTLVGVSLALVTLLLSVPIVRWCTLDLHHAQTQAAATVSFDQALDVLRQDVWQAHQIKVIDPGNLQLSSPSGQLTWRLDASGILHRRESGGADRHWQSPAPAIHFGHAGSVVTCTVPDAPGQPDRVLGMTSPAADFTEYRP